MRVATISFAAALAAFLAAGCAVAASGPEGGSHGERGQIVAVADGDTVTVKLRQGPTVDVRLLAIDSPEKYATRYGSPDECGSAAASSFMESFRGSQVSLVADPTQDDRDTYGRLLRYVQLRGGTDLGAAEVRRGLAVPYLFRDPAKRLTRYRALAARAAASDYGTWGPPCNGDFHSSVPGQHDG